jgi:hypothetical protein
MEFMLHISICDTQMMKKLVSKTMRLKPYFVSFISLCHRSMILVLKSQSFMTIAFTHHFIMGIYIGPAHTIFSLIYRLAQTKIGHLQNKQLYIKTCIPILYYTHILHFRWHIYYKIRLFIDNLEGPKQFTYGSHKDQKITVINRTST